MEDIGEAKICNMGFKVGVQNNISGFHVTMKDNWATIMLKIAQTFGSLHYDYVLSLTNEMVAIVSMKQVSQTSISHVFIHQKISVMVGENCQQFDYMSIYGYCLHIINHRN